MTDCRTPSVSVVCAWYNRADFINDTIGSLLAQDHTNFEIVVVNDGSTDPRVREILDSYNDTRLRVIHQENTGFTTAIANAINAARAPLVAIQGAGDISMPQRLRLQSNYLQARPNCCLVGAPYARVVVGGERDGQSRLVAPEETVISKERLQTGNPINHGDVMLRKSALLDVGGYRSPFQLAQDFDLWLRLARAGSLEMMSGDALIERRVFVNEGISARIDKTLIQTIYVHVAKKCEAERNEFGADVVDVFGKNAMLFFARDRYTANLIARASLKYFATHQSKEGRFLALLAVRHGLGLLPAVVSLLGLISKKSVGEKIVIWIAKSLPIKDQREASPLFPACT